MRRVLKWMHVSRWKVLSILLIMVAIASGYIILHDTETTYEFDSNLVFDGKMICSTRPIMLPNYLQYDGSYEYTNNTGYKIYVFDRTAGFVELVQGKNGILEHPLAFFVVSPEEREETKESAGKLIVKKIGTSLSGCYTIKADKQQSLECIYRIEI